MPKTRSGKIMRHVLATISNNEDDGDISTLANPEVVVEIQQMKWSSGVADLVRRKASEEHMGTVAIPQG